MLLFLFMTITFRCNNRSPITFSQFVFVCLLFYDDLLPNAYLHNFMKENVRVQKTKKLKKSMSSEVSVSQVLNQIMHLTKTIMIKFPIYAVNLAMCVCIVLFLLGHHSERQRLVTDANTGSFKSRSKQCWRYSKRAKKINARAFICRHRQSVCA